MIRESINRISENSKVNDLLRTEFPDIRFKLTENSEYMKLMIIVVKYDDRGNGLGEKFMKRLFELAEKVNKDVFLTPDDSYAEMGDMKKSALIKWYKKLGVSKKHRDDFRSQDTMCYYTKQSIN